MTVHSGRFETGEVESETLKNAGTARKKAEARFLRYRAFESFLAEKNVSCICLAHNRNDQLETLLMRFLRGRADRLPQELRACGIYVRPTALIFRGTALKRFLEVRLIFTGVPTVQTAIQGIFATESGM